MDTVSGAFKGVYDMFGGNLGGANTASGGTGPFGVTPQPVSGSDNSLTAFWRGLSNLAGTAAPQFLQMGGSLIGQGTGVAQGGLEVTGQGLEDIQPAVDFYSKILSGDPSATTAALAPTAANLSAIYSGATDQAMHGMPAGGFRANMLAGLPYQQAAQIGNAAVGLQPLAAQNVEKAGVDIAGIGQGISGTGVKLGELGTTLTGQGLTSLQATIEDMLRKMGINIEGGTANLFSKVVSSL